MSSILTLMSVVVISIVSDISNLLLYPVHFLLASQPSHQISTYSIFFHDYITHYPSSFYRNVVNLYRIIRHFILVIFSFVKDHLSSLEDVLGFVRGLVGSDLVQGAMSLLSLLVVMYLIVKTYNTDYKRLDIVWRDSRNDAAEQYGSGVAVVKPESSSEVVSLTPIKGPSPAKTTTVQTVTPTKGSSPSVNKLNTIITPEVLPTTKGTPPKSVTSVRYTFFTLISTPRPSHASDHISSRHWPQRLSRPSAQRAARLFPSKSTRLILAVQRQLHLTRHKVLLQTLLMSQRPIVHLL